MDKYLISKEDLEAYGNAVEAIARLESYVEYLEETNRLYKQQAERWMRRVIELEDLTSEQQGVRGEANKNK